MSMLLRTPEGDSMLLRIEQESVWPFQGNLICGLTLLVYEVLSY
jgi:hypothetical protein